MLKALRAKGPVLPLDAGNALFRSVEAPDAAAKSRASFILEIYAALGVGALSPGFRDLSAGTAWLSKAAAAAKLPVISANLREGEASPFPASVVLTSNGVKVGVVGLSPAGPITGPGAMKGLALGPAAKAALAALPKDVDVKVVLAAVPYAESQALAAELKDLADVVVQAGGDARGFPPAQRVEGVVLSSGGIRGQAVGVLSLGLGSGGAWFDLDEKKREGELAKSLEGRIVDLKQRLAQAPDAETKRSLETTLKDFEGRVATLKAQAKQAPVGRSFSLEWKVLDREWKDDEALKKKVLVHEPTYKGSH